MWWEVAEFEYECLLGLGFVLEKLGFTTWLELKKKLWKLVRVCGGMLLG